MAGEGGEGGGGEGKGAQISPKSAPNKTKPNGTKRNQLLRTISGAFRRLRIRLPELCGAPRRASEGRLKENTSLHPGCFLKKKNVFLFGFKKIKIKNRLFFSRFFSGGGLLAPPKVIPTTRDTPMLRSRGVLIRGQHYTSIDPRERKACQRLQPAPLTAPPEAHLKQHPKQHPKQHLHKNPQTAYLLAPPLFFRS